MDSLVEESKASDCGCHPPAEVLEHLQQAERDLERARAKEREAQEEVASAEAKVREAIEEIENPRVFTVEVLYDGVKKAFQVRVEETVKHLLDRVIHAF